MTQSNTTSMSDPFMDHTLRHHSLQNRHAKQTSKAGRRNGHSTVKKSSSAVKVVSKASAHTTDQACFAPVYQFRASSSHDGSYRDTTTLSMHTHQKHTKTDTNKTSVTRPDYKVATGPRNKKKRDITNKLSVRPDRSQHQQYYRRRMSNDSRGPTTSAVTATSPTVDKYAREGIVVPPRKRACHRSSDMSQLQDSNAALIDSTTTTCHMSADDHPKPPVTIKPKQQIHTCVTSILHSSPMPTSVTQRGNFEEDLRRRASLSMASAVQSSPQQGNFKENVPPPSSTLAEPYVTMHGELDRQRRTSTSSTIANTTLSTSTTTIPSTTLLPLYDSTLPSHLQHRVFDHRVCTSSPDPTPASVVKVGLSTYSSVDGHLAAPSLPLVDGISGHTTYDASSSPSVITRRCSAPVVTTSGEQELQNLCLYESTEPEEEQEITLRIPPPSSDVSVTEQEDVALDGQEMVLETLGEHTLDQDALDEQELDQDALLAALTTSMPNMPMDMQPPPPPCRHRRDTNGHLPAHVASSAHILSSSPYFRQATFSSSPPPPVRPAEASLMSMEEDGIMAPGFLKDNLVDVGAEADGRALRTLEAEDMDVVASSPLSNMPLSKEEKTKREVDAIAATIILWQEFRVTEVLQALENLPYYQTLPVPRPIFLQLPTHLAGNDDNDSEWLEESFDVYRHALHRQRACYAPDPNYFERHPDLSPLMRCILVTWMMEVCVEHGLHRQVLHLAVQYVDRCLSQTYSVPRDVLQMIGVTAIFIAAKMEEIDPPRLKEFNRVCDGACTEEGIKTCEIQIMDTLKWNLHPPSMYFWLCYYISHLKRYYPFLYYTPPAIDKDQTPTPFGKSLKRTLFRQQEQLELTVNIDASEVPFPAAIFENAMVLLDMALHDPRHFVLSNDILAAAALFLACRKPRTEQIHIPTYYPDLDTIMEHVTGHNGSTLESAMQYLSVFESFPVDLETEIERYPKIHRVEEHEKLHLQVHYREAAPMLETWINELTVTEDDVY